MILSFILRIAEPRFTVTKGPCFIPRILFSPWLCLLARATEYGPTDDRLQVPDVQGPRAEQGDRNQDSEDRASAEQSPALADEGITSPCKGGG